MWAPDRATRPAAIARDAFDRLSAALTLPRGAGWPAREPPGCAARQRQDRLDRAPRNATIRAADRSTSFSKPSLVSLRALWVQPAGQNQIEHLLIDERRQAVRQQAIKHIPATKSELRKGLAVDFDSATEPSIGHLCCAAPFAAGGRSQRLLRSPTATRPPSTQERRGREAPQDRERHRANRGAPARPTLRALGDPEGQDRRSRLSC